MSIIRVVSLSFLVWLLCHQMANASLKHRPCTFVFPTSSDILFPTPTCTPTPSDSSHPPQATIPHIPHPQSSPVLSTLSLTPHLTPSNDDPPPVPTHPPSSRCKPVTQHEILPTARRPLHTCPILSLDVCHTYLVLFWCFLLIFSVRVLRFCVLYTCIRCIYESEILETVAGCLAYVLPLHVREGAEI